ncbi:hypothetical protein [Glycomyces sp. YM15]|uniref:hypothetical protein n=1 Tax=Glycomyces sp. YM15 TaxID=2800446 RepID=UPI001964A916|nr:hypothetical protein [Glycomyces sp. YM15]
MRLTRHRQYPIEERHVDEAGASLHGGADGTAKRLPEALDTDVAALFALATEHAGLLSSITAFIDQFPNLKIQTGRSSLSFATTDAHSHPVTFQAAFANAPIVLPNIDAAPAASARWDARAINTSTTGFTFFVYSNASGAATAWTNVGFSWLALSLTG